MLISQLVKDCIFSRPITRLYYLLWSLCRGRVVVTSHLKLKWEWRYRSSVGWPIRRTFQNAIADQSYIIPQKLREPSKLKRTIQSCADPPWRLASYRALCKSFTHELGSTLTNFQARFYCACSMIALWLHLVPNKFCWEKTLIFLHEPIFNIFIFSTSKEVCGGCSAISDSSFSQLPWSLSQLMINAGPKLIYKEWLSSVLFSKDGHWRLLTSAMSNVD